MKTKISMMIMLLMLMTGSQIYATVWRVNNNPGVNANFSSVTTAISSAAAGDTLYIEGSPYSYGDVTLAKKLVFIGAGYMLSLNDSTQANAAASTFGLLTINSGAQGSVFSGISVTGTPAYGAATVTVNTNDISFIRCNLNASVGNQTSNPYSYSGAVLRLASGVSNILITGCFIFQQWSYTSSSCTYYCPSAVYALHMLGSNSGIVVTNNIIKYGSKTTKSQITSQYAINMPTSSQAVFVNNVIMGTFVAYNSTVANNIHIIDGANGSYVTSSSYPNVTQNNIGHSTQFGTTNGNQSNVNMTNVFSYSGGENDDKHYQLKTGSPALGAGVQGVDCGAFGGTSPYKLSGLPGIPAIFNATVPATSSTSSGINVTIKAKTHE